MNSGVNLPTVCFSGRGGVMDAGKKKLSWSCSHSKSEYLRVTEHSEELKSELLVEVLTRYL